MKAGGWSEGGGGRWEEGVDLERRIYELLLRRLNEKVGDES